MGDLGRVGIPVPHLQVQIAQHRFGDAAVGFIRCLNADAANQLGQSRIVDVFVVEMGLVEAVVGQGDSGSVGHTVVGGFPRLGMPLFIIAGHYINRLLQSADVHRSYLVNPEVGNLAASGQGGLYYGLRIQAQGKLLDAAFVNLERLPLVAAERFQPVGFAGNGGEEAVFALKDGGRAGKPAFRQHCGEHGVAAGVGISAAFPVRQDADPRLAEGQVGRKAQVQGLFRLRRRQAHGAGGAHRTGDCAVGNMVKADVFQAESVAEPAERFVGNGGGRNQTPPAGAGQLGAGQRSGDAVAGMPRFQRGIAVVEIQIADHHAVGEGCQVGAAGLAAADDGNRAAAGHFAGQLPRNLARLGSVAADGAADAVNNHPFEQMDSIGRQVAVVQAGRVAGDIFGDGGHIRQPPGDSQQRRRLGLRYWPAHTLGIIARIVS